MSALRNYSNAEPFRLSLDESVETASYRAAPEAGDLLVVLVDWSILKGREGDFLRYWSEREAISDRSGLIGEFLNRVRGVEDVPFGTWKQRQDCTTFINVGLWRSREAYLKELGPRLKPRGPMMPFEFEPRRRLFLGPQRWRLGQSLLPTDEHAGVL